MIGHLVISSIYSIYSIGTRIGCQKNGQKSAARFSLD